LVTAAGRFFALNRPLGRRATSIETIVNFFLDISVKIFIIRYMSNINTKQLERFAEVFKALSNPNRLKIFQRLASCCKPGTISVIDTCETACVGELGRELDIVPSTVSHHIKELRQAGLIRTRRRGQRIECWIDPGVVEQLRRFFAF
jgi:ArsR family transcriptional regulator